MIILVLLSKFNFNDTSWLLLLLSSWLPKLVCKFKFLPAISCSLSGEMLSIHKNGSVCKTQVLRLSLHKCQSKILCNNICYISIYSDYFKGNPLKLFQSYESNFQFNTKFILFNQYEFIHILLLSCILTLHMGQSQLKSFIWFSAIFSTECIIQVDRSLRQYK